jgi:signal transduction histidine kinase
VLENLITRAVQLSSEGVVTVRASAAADAIHVEVRDTAPAVRSSEALFDPLRSPTDLLRTCGSGSGLALSVLRDLALAIGGELSVAPGEQRGNATVLSVPWDLPPEGVGRPL